MVYWRSWHIFLSGQLFFRIIRIISEVCAKAPRNSTKIKKQKALKSKPQRIEPIEDLCQPCLNGNNYGQEEECGLPREELCRISRETYNNHLEFKKNLFSIPANKQGKRFLQKYAQTLQWVDEEDGNQHFAWACNIILPVICLQVSDPKGKMRHHTKILEERLNKIDAGEMEVVCNETKRIQRTLLARSKPCKGTNQKKKNTGGNWITEARRHVTTGELRRAKRCIEEDEQSMEPISNDTFNKLAAMFPQGKIRTYYFLLQTQMQQSMLT